MFFKKRYIKVSRFFSKYLFLYNLFFNFNFFFFEFLGGFGYLRVYLKNVFFLKFNNFLKIFSLSFFSNSGYSYSIFSNIIKGLTFKYTKKLTVFGVGYKSFLKGNYLYLYLSYSHPLIYNIPTDIFLKVILNEITITGINKQRVGEFCSLIRSSKKPDIYKGKGLRYLNEKINLKLIKKN